MFMLPLCRPPSKNKVLSKESLKKAKCIPVIIHGDGVEFVDNDSLEVLSVGPLLGTGDSMDCMFCIGAFPYSVTHKIKAAGTRVVNATWKQPMGAIAESFTHCLNGHRGDGKVIAGGYRFVIWGITGDNEHHANFFGLPHWSMNDWCASCNCNTSSRNGLVFGKRKWSEIAVVDDELSCRYSANPIFKVPGVTTASVEDDPLHDLYTHGVLGILIGSALHTLIYREGPGRQKVPPAHRLSLIWQKIKEICHDLKITNEMSQLSLAHIHTPDKAHSSNPYFKAKGHHTKTILPAIAKLCAEANDGSDMNQHRNTALNAIANFCALLDVAPVVPSDSQAAMAVKFMDEFLVESEWLNSWAKKKGNLLFNIVNKHHYCWHLARKFKYLNPRWTWTFKTEDYVGKISTLGHNCSRGKTKLLVPKVFCEKYRECEHLRLSRGCFGDD